jgi:hypothetical protein
LCAENGWPNPCYQVQAEGPDREPTFTFRVQVGILGAAVASGPSKKLAKHRVAATLIEDLKCLTKVPKVVRSKNVQSTSISVDLSDPINDLQEYCRREGFNLPTYRLTNNATFNVVCSFGQNSEVIGTTKKEAAFNMLQTIKSIPPHLFVAFKNSQKKVVETNDFESRNGAEEMSIDSHNKVVKKDDGECVHDAKTTSEELHFPAHDFERKLSKPNELQTTVVKSNAVKSNDVKSNVVKSNEVKSNVVRSADVNSNDVKLPTETNRNLTLERSAFDFMFETNPEMLLRKVVGEQGRSLCLIEKSSAVNGKWICFARIENPDIVFTGSGFTPENARADSCRNALQYFCLVKSLTL